MQKENKDNIHISVQTAFIPEQSSQRENRLVFSYTITIENKGQLSVQPLSRHWLISDSNGEKSTVTGEGVIGKQPIIAPNKKFQYTSGCVLKSPVGTMEGFYQMIDENKNSFQVTIPVFRLALPNIVN